MYSGMTAQRQRGLAKGVARFDMYTYTHVHEHIMRAIPADGFREALTSNSRAACVSALGSELYDVLY